VDIVLDATPLMEEPRRCRTQDNDEVELQGGRVYLHLGGPARRATVQMAGRSQPQVDPSGQLSDETGYSPAPGGSNGPGQAATTLADQPRSIAGMG
jgi:hypothetical protein